MFIKVNPVAACILAALACGNAQAQTGVWTALGPSGGQPAVIVIDPSNSSTIYAGTGSGVFKSTDGGEQWARSSQGNFNDLITSLAIDASNPQTLYSATLGTGVFKSTDGAAFWSPVNNGLTQLFVNQVTIDPLNSQTVYAATLDGVFKSADGGELWAAANNGLGLERNVAGLAVHPSEAQTLYAALPASGVFKSEDGGASWSDFSQGLTALPTGPLAFSPDATLYAATEQGVFSSADGQPWVFLQGSALREDSFVQALTVDPSDAQTLYAGLSDALIVSRDEGETWTALEVGDFPGNSVFSLAVDPADPQRILAGTQDGFYRSDDGTQSWKQLREGLMARIIQSVAADPTNPLVLYAGGSDGVYKSTDGGLHWRPSRQGAQAPITHLAVDPSNPRTVYALTDRGFLISRDGARRWQSSSRGLAGTPQALAIDSANPRNLYLGTAPLTGVYKSVDGGANWQASNQGLASRDVRALVIDPSNPETLYAGTKIGIFKSVDGAASWTEANQGFNALQVRSLAVSPINPQILHAGTLAGTIFKSVDGAASWQQLDGTFATVISSLAADDADPNKVYMSARGSGVFFTPGSDQLWQPLPFGLSNRQVTQVIWVGETRRIFASSFGGVLGLQMEDLPGSDVTAIEQVSGNLHLGGTAIFEIALTNSGAESGDLEFVQALPPGLRVLRAEADSGEAVVGPGTEGVTWNGFLEPQAMVDIRIHAFVEESRQGTVLAAQGLLRAESAGGPAILLTDDPSSEQAGDPTQFEVQQALTDPNLLAVPRSAGAERTFVGLAVANLNDSESTLHFQGRAGDGQPTGEQDSQEPVPARGQAAFLSTEAVDSEDAQTLTVQGDQPIQGFFMLGDLDSKRLDGIGAPLEDAQLLFLPQARQTAEAQTRIFLFNASADDSAEAEISLFNSQGDPLGTVTLQIAPQGSLWAPLDEVFGEALHLQDGYVRIESGSPLRSFELVLGEEAFSTLPAQLPLFADRLWAPHLFADTQGGTSRLRILNTGTRSAELQLRLFDDEMGQVGEAQIEVLPQHLSVVDLAAYLSPESQGAVLGHLQIEMNAGSLGPFSLQPSLQAAIEYDTGPLQTLSSLPLIAQPESGIRFLQVAQSDALGIFQGLALLNTSSEPAAVTVTAFGTDGLQTAVRQIILQAGSRAVGLLDEETYFGSGFQQVGGYLEVSSAVPIAAYALFGGERFLSAIQGRNGSN